MNFTKDIYFNGKPQVDGELELTYNGFLSGSTDLWTVYGFGSKWDKTSEVKMEKTSEGFKANIPILDYDTFNFCFKNGNNEWDNNSYANYVSEIEPSYNSQLIALFDELFKDDIQTEENVPSNSYDEFDIDELIEEILEPLVSYSNVSSGFTDEDLSYNVVNENYVSLAEVTNEKNGFELTNDGNVENATISENNESFDMENISFEYTKDETDNSEFSQLVDPKFAISPRKLSKFYLFRKKLRIIAYKIARLPQLIFGNSES